MERRFSVIDAATRRRLIERFGPWVDEWCDALPSRLDRLEQKWSLCIESSLSSGQTSCVLLCKLSGADSAVLKISPERELTITEGEALTAWSSSGRLPQLIETDMETGALLMEAIQPGTALNKVQAVAHLDDIADLVSDLREAPSAATVAEFPPLIERVEFIFALFRRRLHESGLSSVVSPDLFERSLEEARELAAASSTGQVLLHGDLHPANVLYAGEEQGLIAIDPRPCRGDPAFDLIDWVVAGPADTQTLIDRSERLARRACVDPERLWRWCVCTAVLNAIVHLVRERRLDAESRLLLALATEQVQ